MNINATLLGQALAFVVFVWFTMKYVWPPLLSAIEERQKKIADGLDFANKASKDLGLAKQKASEELREAKRVAAEVIEQANKRKANIIDEAKDEAQIEREKIIEQGKLEILTEQERVRTELRQKVSDLAIIGAEKIICREVNAETHKDILDNITAQL